MAPFITGVRTQFETQDLSCKNIQRINTILFLLLVRRLLEVEYILDPKTEDAFLNAVSSERAYLILLVLVRGHIFSRCPKLHVYHFNH